MATNNNGNLISQRRGSTSFYLFDALGSTRILVNSAGSITDTYNFKAFGETNADSISTTNSFRWVGELGYYFDDDRDAYYLRARAYSPTLARFLSLDPLGFGGGDWNLYRYVGNRPTFGVDPNGLISFGLHQGFICNCGGLVSAAFDAYCPAYVSAEMQIEYMKALFFEICTSCCVATAALPPSRITAIWKSYLIACVTAEWCATFLFQGTRLRCPLFPRVF